jgi:hypothetical protein
VLSGLGKEEVSHCWARKRSVAAAISLSKKVFRPKKKEIDSPPQLKSINYERQLNLVQAMSQISVESPRTTINNDSQSLSLVAQSRGLSEFTRNEHALIHSCSTRAHNCHYELLK